MRNSVVTLLLAPACLALMAGTADARSVTGTTSSASQNLKVVVTATDGSQYASNVTVTKTKTVNGKKIYIGKYALDVPVGKNVMVQFAKVNNDGSLTYVTTAHYAESAARSTTRTWHFVMSNGSSAVGLGATKVGKALAIPVFDPLTQVDEDGNGVDDYDDGDQCDDDNQGDEDTDQDDNGVPDDEDDQGQDGDGDNQ